MFSRSDVQENNGYATDGDAMPAVEPADPFEGTCQLCGTAIAPGESYYTVAIDGKEHHICEPCYNRLVEEGRLNPSDPAPFSIA